MDLFTLSFLLCIPSGPCTHTGPDTVFSSQARCHEAASVVLQRVAQQVQSGAMPPHQVAYQCTSWGVAS